MKILVFGRNGQLARELAAMAGARIACLGREQLDLSHPDTVLPAIETHSPDVVINAAAYTDVDGAEADEARASIINAQAPGVMARACAGRGIPLVHVSTDYVFDGSGSKPWRPGDSPRPLNAYGRSKLAGEAAVRTAGGVHVILRTSRVFSAHGSNFAKTMLQLAQTRDELSVVEDQIGGPTPAADLAGAVLEIARQLIREPGKGGTYHFSGSPDVSWKSFACETFSRAGRAIEVTGIATGAWPTPAARPLNSRLDCTSTADVFGVARPDWKAGLDAVLADLRAGTFDSGDILHD